MKDRGEMSVYIRCAALLCIVMLLLTSCQAQSYGSLVIEFAEERTIQPSDEAISVTHIRIWGRQTGGGSASLSTQLRQMGDRILIEGLLPGTWEITLCGLSANNADAVVTRQATQSLVVASGHASRAVFSLAYLTEGLGTCAVSLTWNEQASSVATVAGTLSQTGEVRYTSTGEGPFPIQEGVYTGSCGFDGVVAVGTYDLGVLLTNRSGTHIPFPNLDSVRIFSQRRSEGTIALSFPVASITHMVESASFAAGTVASIAINSFPLAVPIFYTTDGTEPTIASNRYTSPLSITETTTIKAVAALNGYADSAVSTGVYTASNFAITRPPQIGAMDIVTNDYQTYAVVVIDETGLQENHYSWYVDGLLQVGESSYHITLDSLVPGNRYRIMAKIQKGDQSLNTFTQTEYFTIPIES